jgi:hypothetical protein
MRWARDYEFGRIHAGDRNNRNPLSIALRGVQRVFLFVALKGGDDVGVRAFPVLIGVRLTKTEKMLLDTMAKQENTTVSGMIRELIVLQSVRPLLGGREVQGAQD